MAQLFSLAEIKQYNGKSRDKTWVVIHDCVYDVTEYLQDVIDILKLWIIENVNNTKIHFFSIQEVVIW